MKKFLCILFALLLIPFGAFATGIGSPTGAPESVTCSDPSIFFLEMELNDYISQRLATVANQTKGYRLMNIVLASLYKEYHQVTWSLAYPIYEADEPFVIIIDTNAINKQELVVDENGDVIVDFTAYRNGMYFLCFFVKEE